MPKKPADPVEFTPAPEMTAAVEAPAAPPKPDPLARLIAILMTDHAIQIGTKQLLHALKAELEG